MNADQCGEILALKIIGDTSATRLVAIGIETKAQIEELGAVEVNLRLQDRFPGSRNMLWGLQGALLKLPYNQIPSEIKQSLMDELERLAI